MNRRENRKEKIEQGADKVTKWIGSAGSLVVHTLLFTLCFISIILGADFDRVMLVLTTVVSLDVDEIQEDVDEIQKDVDEIQEDVEEIEGEVVNKK